ncbi:hypothetical protein PRECH8_03750 [Insulibacter thermoxylanivorax]|uniref:Gcp-like domain-containing protein n=1 Tax=Insulibacter thermoxylanivorax TaxID=2749268 RepID=A0A916QCL1_9BACL|nr:tRNA (adenosine(37)-N6)-threonylcarbamoyltransferase complex dimerization subunit type 1 TsaB [Insulibacter thermoxylanivorax]GFR37079.1 hypothetical protein PRECH8_03750 [Insulibacter thermoxylanivorax]
MTEWNHAQAEKWSDRYWLALDTATANMCIAVMKGMQTLAANESTVERNHSVRLVPEIQALLKRTGLGMRDLSAIAVGRGPGSYTGVRIGVTVGKTLAWSLQMPLVSVSSIGALAFGYVRGEGVGTSGARAKDSERIWLVPMLDARRKQVYTALYEWLQGQAGEGLQSEETDRSDTSRSSDVEAKLEYPGNSLGNVHEGSAHGSAQEGNVEEGYAQEGDAQETLRFAAEDVNGVWRPLARDQIVLFSDWVEQLAQRIAQLPEEKRPHRVVFVGEVEGFREEAERSGARLGVPVLAKEQVVHGTDLAWLAWERLIRGQYENIHAVVPNYTQLAEAEQKLLARQK